MLRRTTLLALLSLTVLLAACGGGGGGGDGEDGASEFPEAARATSEDDEGTTFPLQAGRYRLSYTAPTCEDVVVSITSVDGGFTYEQQQRVTTSFVNDMIEGEYTITVVSDCDEWQVNLNKF